MRTLLAREGQRGALASPGGFTLPGRRGQCQDEAGPSEVGDAQLGKQSGLGSG